MTTMIIQPFLIRTLFGIDSVYQNTECSIHIEASKVKNIVESTGVLFITIYFTVVLFQNNDWVKKCMEYEVIN